MCCHMIVITSMIFSTCPMYKSRVTIERKIGFTDDDPLKFMVLEVYFYDKPTEAEIIHTVSPYFDGGKGWFILGWETPHLV